MAKPFVTEKVLRFAKKLKAKVIIEPEYGYVGRITFKNGKNTFFRSTKFNINSLGSTEIALDKGYASFFLKQFGYSVPKWLAVFNAKLNTHLDIKKDIHAGFKFAQKIGFPVIIKPNAKSQGDGVMKVYNKSEYYKSAKKILAKNSVMLVQEFYAGNDYRIVVLDNEVISVYQRLPLSVVGNGKSNILKLLQQKQKEFIKTNRDTVVDFSDYRIKEKLRHEKLTLRSILQKGKKITLLYNANLSDGGDAIDYTRQIHVSFKKLAIKITKNMGLRLCGVDIITEDITKPCKKYSIIEINAAPGLDNYAAMGKKQEKIVDRLYIKVLKALQK